MQTIPITSIIVEDRQRQDLGDVDQLARSIRRFGLIQPIVLDSENRLIAGGRRLAACTKLGMADIPFVCKDDCTNEQRSEMELEENVRRKALTWQEHCRAIAHIHKRHDHQAALDGERWTFEMTGELLGVSSANAWYCTTIAKLLADGDKEITACENLWAALQLLAARRAVQAEKLIIQHMDTSPHVALVPPAPQAEFDLQDPTLDGRLMPNAPPSVSMLALPKAQITTHCGCALEWLSAQPDESLECIYSDPPYGIDMDNLSQDGLGLDINLVEATHQVAPNMELLSTLIPILGQKTAPTAYVCLWCDITNWHFLATAAASAGFAVQRWPIVWVKTHRCQNFAASLNFTKSIEVAMVLRKQKAVLNRTRPVCHWIGENDKPTTVTNPFWKPLGLHKFILDGIANIGVTVVDLFAGCGSIPLACMELGGRNIIAIEKDPTHYVQLLETLKLTKK